MGSRRRVSQLWIWLMKSSASSQSHGLAISLTYSIWSRKETVFKVKMRWWPCLAKMEETLRDSSLPQSTGIKRCVWEILESQKMMTANRRRHQRNSSAGSASHRIRIFHDFNILLTLLPKEGHIEFCIEWNGKLWKEENEIFVELFSSSKVAVVILTAALALDSFVCPSKANPTLPFDRSYWAEKLCSQYVLFDNCPSWKMWLLN